MLSYVYDSGLAELDELAAAAIRMVQPVNGLDPTTFTSVAVMEREVVALRPRRCSAATTTWSAPSRPAAPRAACSRSRRRATCGRPPAARERRACSRRSRCTRRSRRPRTTSVSTLDLVPVEADGRVAAERLVERNGTGCRARRRLGAELPARRARPDRRRRGGGRRARNRVPRRRVHRRLGAAVLAGARPVGLRGAPGSRA